MSGCDRSDSRNNLRVIPRPRWVMSTPWYTELRVTDPPTGFSPLFLYPQFNYHPDPSETNCRQCIDLKYKHMFNSIFLFNFLGPEMIVVFLAILLLFGGKKIPELMKGIGKGIREFNTAKGTLEKELQAGMDEQEQREKDARELKELREREARRQREEQFITREEK